MKRLLVVPRKTSRTPEGAWVGPPDLFAPRPQLVEVSVVFTGDLTRARAIADHWRQYAKRVRVGGPALDDPGGDFTPGRYVKKGIVHTSRGCSRQCPWCYVWKREGVTRELPITEGHVVEDSNLLACNRSHIVSVFEMLKAQKGVQLKGGIDARLLRDWHIEAMRGLRLKEVWLAYDDKANRKQVLRAIDRLKRAGMKRDKIRCYVMIGRNETRSEAEERLIDVYESGANPFSMVYDGIEHDRAAWRTMATTWCNPARYKNLAKTGWENRKYQIQEAR